jgi:tetratricopeptide (TPR) repeat protein
MALVSLVDQGHPNVAETRARDLLAHDPDNGMLWKLLGVALLRQGKDALPALRRSTALLPDDGEAHRHLAAALRDSGRSEDALRSLHRALELRPTDADGFTEAADLLRALGRAREAVPLYERSLLLNPRLVEARNDLGNAFLESGKPLDAARCYRLALELRPDDAVILCNLGNAQRLLGLYDEAKICLERGIARNQRLGPAHGFLGMVHIALGRREAAVENFQRALALDPNDQLALTNLGHVLRDLGRRQDAIDVYRRALALDPARPENHCHLGTVLFELRRVEAATDCFRRALELQPNHAPAHLSLALARRQQRRADAAEASCRAALAIDPKYVEALAFLGELTADRGRFAEAEALFVKATEIDPAFFSGYVSIATHRKMTAADTGWLAQVHGLLAKRLPLNAEISLRYALGKYYDDVAQYDDAFDSYKSANELTKRYGARYERTQFAALVTRIIERFQPEFIRDCAARGSDAELPLLIVGMPRSGTSLSEQILASHPAVLGAGELTFWHGAFVRLERAGLFGAAGASLVPAAATNYLERLKSVGPDALRVIDKMPANFLYVGLIHAAFPKARIIHMQRDPLDTALSIYFQNFFNIGPYANDLDDLAHYYGQYLRVMEHWRRVLPATALLEVPYEGLIEDQERWTRRMLDFAGLPWDPRCLNFQDTDRVVITASKWQVRQKLYRGSCGRSRNYEKHLGPLRHLGDRRAPGATHDPSILT